MSQVRLTFPSSCHGGASIRAHGTGLDGRVYVGHCLHDWREGSWTAPLWPKSGKRQVAEQIQAASLRKLRDAVRIRLMAGGAWWS